MDWREFLRPNKQKWKYFLAITIPLVLFSAGVHYFFYHWALSLTNEEYPILGMQIVNNVFAILWLWYPFAILGGYLIACGVYKAKTSEKKGPDQIPMKKRLLLVIAMLAYWIPIAVLYYAYHIWWIFIAAVIVWLIIFYILLERMKIF